MQYIHMYDQREYNRKVKEQDDGYTLQKGKREWRIKGNEKEKQTKVTKIYSESKLILRSQTSSTMNITPADNCGLNG